jgi:hypothetical protein
VALGIYYGIALLLIFSGTAQVTRQLFFLPGRASPFHGCREGLRSLAAAVDRARQAAPGEGGEDAAIARFRGALAPEWGFRDEVAASCRSSEADERALDAIERLRYAEEHAARREAGDLAPLRRRVHTILEKDLGDGAAGQAPASAPPASSAK